MDDQIARYRRVAGSIRDDLLGPTTQLLGEPEFLLRSRADSDLLFEVCRDYADFLESAYPKYVEARSSAYSAVDRQESTDLRQAVQEAARQGRMAIRCGVRLMVSRAESSAATTNLGSQCPFARTPRAPLHSDISCDFSATQLLRPHEIQTPSKEQASTPQRHPG